MFEFDDVSIISSLCQAEVLTREVDGELEIDFGYTIVVDGKKISLTESELQYMMDEVVKVKEGKAYE